MTRKVVAIEGRQTVDGRLLIPGSLTVKDNSISVARYLDEFGTPMVVGKATDFNRDVETGEISFDIITRDNLPEDLNAHVYLTHIVCTALQSDGAMVIDSAIIRHIYLSADSFGWKES